MIVTTEALRRVVAAIESLPDEEQDRLANVLEAELNRRWDEVLESPESIAILDRMADGALRDAREGRVRELNNCGPRPL